MKIGFIGCGKMGSALLRGMLDAGVCKKESVGVTDVAVAAVQALERQTGVRGFADGKGLVEFAEVVVVCVKPGDVSALLQSLAPTLAGKLVVSIAAGVTIAQLSEAAGAGARVIRVMPNTPALIRKGASAYACAANVSEEDAHFVEKMLGAVGVVAQVKESLLDAVTAVSGSGPAYVYLVIESIADGGVRMGLSRELALQLAAQTVLGAAGMVMETGMHPAQLKDQVTSPGGTTIAALHALEERAVRAAFIDAVEAATRRGMELGKGK